MELKVYQQNALDAFSRWLEALEEARNNSEKAIEALKQAGVDSIPDELHNYPQKAWQNLKQNDGVAPTAGDYVTRTDDAKRPIPHVCFKVPTGGGKTLLAASALERLHRQRGLTLWIVPTRAIYTQTKKALWDKEHPYRKMLERASAGSVKMLEKDDPFNRDDIANHLCVMLLMLPAANRQKGKEFLRMFKDTGKYPSFFSPTVTTFSAMYACEMNIPIWSAIKKLGLSCRAYLTSSKCSVLWLFWTKHIKPMARANARQTKNSPAPSTASTLEW